MQNPDILFSQTEIDWFKEVWAKLGSRQRQVAMLLAHGMSPAKVSIYLHITQSTVYSHRLNVSHKLKINCHAFTKAVFAAMGVLQPYKIEGMKRHNRHHRPSIKETDSVDQTTMGETNG